MTYLNTPAIFSQKPLNVDRENGIIKGISIIRVGEAKGHGFRINENFVSDVVRMGNEHTPGIKARFGHPNMCSTALGTYLGRFKNFEKIGTKATADLYLDNSAKKSPKGNLFEYVLDMAENNPDMFGASIAFKKGDFLEQLEDVDGKKVPVKYATIQALHATDFVDSPAATDGLFEVFHEDDFASQATLFLDEHPEIFELLDAKPEILDEFLQKYKLHKKTKSMSFTDEITKLKKWVSDNFSALKTGIEEKDITALRADFDNQIAQLESKIPKPDTSALELLQADLDAANASIAALTTELNKAKAKPTLPDVNADPALSIQPANKDNAGKVLLSNLPPDLRKKIKLTQKPE